MKVKFKYHATKGNIKTCIELQTLSVNHSLSRVWDYETEADYLGVTKVKNAMTRNFYLELKRFLNFQNNKEQQFNETR